MNVCDSVRRMLMRSGIRLAPKSIADDVPVDVGQKVLGHASRDHYDLCAGGETTPARGSRRLLCAANRTWSGRGVVCRYGHFFEARTGSQRRGSEKNVWFCRDNGEKSNEAA